MSDHNSIILNQNRHKSIPSDCIICAMRPGLYLNQINIYQARFFCSHSSPPSKPHFQPSKTAKVLTILCSCILLYGVYADLNQISGKFTSKHVILYLEMFLNILTVLFNGTFFSKNGIKLREAHGLIAVINNKFKFGVDVLLTGKSAKKIHDILFYATIMFLLEELIMFNITFAVENVDNDLFIRMFMLEILILSNAVLGIACVQALHLYKAIFGRCYSEIEEFLSRLYLSGVEDQTPGSLLIERLQKLQRLYMCLRRNYKLNEQFFQPVVFVGYSLYVCILLIGYGYFGMTFFLGEISMLKFDIYLIIKSLAIAIAFGYLCYEAQYIATMSEELLSFLFKFPISKLTVLECAQIDMLISTLSLQKPDIKASDIFTLGTGLLVSIAGTVLTYVLVALQFHASWSAK
ncbi:hypothetical protein Zmor_007486 [Zophobas morio]|uniref:Gustatory receptor n=1 Tax=Zophobas morio TaxID=2755281 RepID=A0AA38IU38_9CUCU|nr:hypothetical protein Zmor_007486 [Zophobas morio]